MIQTIEDKVFAANVKEIARFLTSRKDIDWEQRRYEIAKACLSAEMANDCHNYHDKEGNVKDAVEYADLLIKELRNTINE